MIASMDDSSGEVPEDSDPLGVGLGRLQRGGPSPTGEQRTYTQDKGIWMQDHEKMLEGNFW